MPLLVSFFVGAQLFTGFCALLFLINRNAVAGRVAFPADWHCTRPGSPAVTASELHEFMPSHPGVDRRHKAQAA